MKKQNIILAFMALTAMFGQMACTPTDLSKANIIPKPVSIVPTGDSFDLTDQTDIYVQGESAELLKIGQYLADKLNPSTGLGIEVKTTSEAPASGNIYLSLSENDAELGDEGYELTITDSSVKLTANKPAGLFYGVQTIRQLLPSKVELATSQKGPWKMATGTIRDYPEYGYRGSMLDVARHFFEVEEVKTLIDQLATYKMNRFHLHLSDDQGDRKSVV